MKKLIIMLVMAAFTVAVVAQDKVIQPYGLAGYTNSVQVAKTAAYTYTYLINPQSVYYYTYSVKLIDNTGSNTATCVLSGSLDNLYWKTITSVSYTGVGSDTTIIGNITSSPVSYKYLKFVITPSDTMWVKGIWLNVLPIGN